MRRASPACRRWASRPPKASASTRAHAVARKRNGYGLAQGDVVLSERADLRDVMRDNAAAALTRAGYRVDANDPAARDVDVHMRQFWLGSNPASSWA